MHAGYLGVPGGYEEEGERGSGYIMPSLSSLPALSHKKNFLYLSLCYAGYLDIRLSLK